LPSDRTNFSSGVLYRTLDRSRALWSVVARDTQSGAVLIEHNGDLKLSTASIGKLILLAYTGHAMLRNPALGATRLDRRKADSVSDSGIWQHLDVDELSVADVARLIFMSSDNLGSNVLLSQFKLERVRAFRSELGLTQTALLDIVRDTRGPEDPDTLSCGTAAELCDFMTRIARNELVSPALSRWLRDGLSLNMDLSMVPSPLCLDPLAHAGDAKGTGGRPKTLIANKTGTDDGVRADVGILGLESRTVAYAAVCNFDEGKTSVRAVMEGMHVVGRELGCKLTHFR
jgi:beta-lactamase class A